MSTLKMFVVYVGTLALLVSSTQQAEADPILGVIDIRPILARHLVSPFAANSLGLAYNPASDVIYLAHGSDFRGGFIYTLDLEGNLLHELDFQMAYRSGTYPTSLSYDSSTGHLFVAAYDAGDVNGVLHLVEMSPDGSTIFGEVTLPSGGGGGIVVRDDGIWQAHFSRDTLRHYTRDGVLIEEVSVASIFPGFPGPEDLTSSFTDGFFIADSFSERIVAVDIAGNEVGTVSTATLGDGRGRAIASDVSTQRIFLQVNNEAIYILSSDLKFVPNVNVFVTFTPLPSTFHTTTNTAHCPPGFVGKFTFTARLTDQVTSPALSDLMMRVVTLTNGNVLLHPQDNTPVRGFFHPVVPIPRAGMYLDGVLSPNESVDVPFVVCLNIAGQRSFRLFVDVLGFPQD